MKAVWNNIVIAESGRTIVIEGNHYFPPDSVKKEYLQPSEYHTVCPWKGRASYYNIVINADTNSDAHGTIPNPKRRQKKLRIISPSGKV